MNVGDLSDDAVVSYLEQLCAIAQHKTDLSQKRTILEALVYELDEMDSDDAFGTEGWRHRFGIPE